MLNVGPEFPESPNTMITGEEEGRWSISAGNTPSTSLHTHKQSDSRLQLAPSALQLGVVHQEYQTLLPEGVLNGGELAKDRISTTKQHIR